MKKETMTRRFYATKSAINAPQILQLLPEAIESAKDRMDSGNLDEYYVVEVVRIVRRQQQPVEVVEIRK